MMLFSLNCDWLYPCISTMSSSNYSFLIVLVDMFLSYVLIYVLLLSSTVFIGLLILLSLFISQIIMLYYIGQQLFASFILGVYVGAILVFFVFVVMSFIFFGKTYSIDIYSWFFFIFTPVVYIVMFYKYADRVMHISAYEGVYHTICAYNVPLYKFDELSSIGILLFDIDMIYLVFIISFILFVALIGSITFNVSNLVKYSASLYRKG